MSLRYECWPLKRDNNWKLAFQSCLLYFLVTVFKAKCFGQIIEDANPASHWLIYFHCFRILKGKNFKCFFPKVQVLSLSLQLCFICIWTIFGLAWVYMHTHILGHEKVPLPWNNEHIFYSTWWLPAKSPTLVVNETISTVNSDFSSSHDNTFAAAVTAVNSVKNRKPACTSDDKGGLVASLFSCCYLSGLSSAFINQERRDATCGTLLWSLTENSAIFHWNREIVRLFERFSVFIWKAKCSAG